MTFQNVLRAALRSIILNRQPHRFKITQIAHFCVVRMVGGVR
jgi:hypothetical protein